MMHYWYIPGFKQSYADITIEKILKVVCDVLNVSLQDMKTRSRTRELVEARQLAWMTIRITLRTTCVAMGDLFNRDHTSVLHGIKTMTNLIQNDPSLFDKFNTINSLL